MLLSPPTRPRARIMGSPWPRGRHKTLLIVLILSCAAFTSSHQNDKEAGKKFLITQIIRKSPKKCL